MRSAQQTLDFATDFLSRQVRRSLEDGRGKLTATSQKLQSHSPARELAARRGRLGALQRRCALLPTRQIEKARESFRRVEGILRVLGPEATLQRGYSITTSNDGAVIKSVVQIKTGAQINTRVADGTFASRVK